MRVKIVFLLIVLCACFSLAFTPAALIYREDFEGILHDAKLRRDFQVWESGAMLNIFLESRMINAGEKAMGVEVLSPNPVNKSRYGSVYRTLEFFQGNWSGAMGVRFWVDNPNAHHLLLSFNFKERHREYWAVADQGIFYLQGVDGLLSQQEIFYSNLKIPEKFSGFVMVPFSSFAVPAWNTAKSNQVVDLNRIESYAFSVTAGENTPFTFYIDDFEVLGQTAFYRISIVGVTNIQIPASGTLLETFDAVVLNNRDQGVDSASVKWAIETLDDSKLSISEDGLLSVPAGAQPGVITLKASWRTPAFTLSKSYSITLSDLDRLEDSVNSADSRSTPPATAQETAYDRFSTQFDRWTTENRPLFVGLLLVAVSGFLTILSLIKSKLV